LPQAELRIAAIKNHIAIGVGPRTVPDLVFHVGIVVVFIWGLIVTARAR
jgi:hypothetical protein